MVAPVLLFAAVGTYLLLNASAGTTYNTVSDSFERSTLGANWSVALGSVDIVNNSDLGFRAASPIGIVSWKGTVLSADHFSQGSISSNKVSNMLTQVFARRRSSDGARYGFHYANDPNTTPAWQLKYDGVPTAQVRVLASSRSFPAPKPGDWLRIEARGSNPVEIKGYLNGTLVLRATDSSSTRIFSGLPGLVQRLQVNTTTTYPTAVWESWYGGSLSS
jgi:hypothetical protein